MQTSKAKLYCNVLLDDDVRKAYYGKGCRPPKDNNYKIIKSKKVKLNASPTNILNVSINIKEDLNNTMYYLTITVNKKQLIKESKILTNLLALINNKEDIEYLVIQCLTK